MTRATTSPDAIGAREATTLTRSCIAEPARTTTTSGPWFATTSNALAPHRVEIDPDISGEVPATSTAAYWRSAATAAPSADANASPSSGCAGSPAVNGG